MATGIGNLPYTMPPVSPFDVITSQAENERIANIESLADGTGIGDNAITTPKLDSGAITADKIDFTTLAFGNYSTSEVDTGFKWVDGKTIYKKTIDLGAMPNNTRKQVPHGITGLSFVVQQYGGATNGTDVFFPLPWPGDNAALSNGIGTFARSTNIDVWANTDRSGFSGYYTIEYTKT